jgi:hypothetical protein
MCVQNLSKCSEKGVILDSMRDLINDLVAPDGVCPNNVIGVLKHITGKLWECVGSLCAQDCEGRGCCSYYAIFRGGRDLERHVYTY